MQITASKSTVSFPSHCFEPPTEIPAFQKIIVQLNLMKAIFLFSF